jgi:hypothetical protein
MKRSINPTFQKTEKPFDCVCVYIAIDINFRCMINNFVIFKFFVKLKFINFNVTYKINESNRYKQTEKIHAPTSQIKTPPKRQININKSNANFRIIQNRQIISEFFNDRFAMDRSLNGAFFLLYYKYT